MKSINSKGATMRYLKGTCLPYADDGVSNKNEQDDKRLDECRDLVFRLFKPRQYLQHACNAILSPSSVYNKSPCKTSYAE